VSHALIIDDNLILSRAIRSGLDALGFDSFDYTRADAERFEFSSEAIELPPRAGSL